MGGSGEVCIYSSALQSSSCCYYEFNRIYTNVLMSFYSCALQQVMFWKKISFKLNLSVVRPIKHSVFVSGVYVWCTHNSALTQNVQEVSKTLTHNDVQGRMTGGCLYLQIHTTTVVCVTHKRKTVVCSLNDSQTCLCACVCLSVCVCMYCMWALHCNDSPQSL